MKKFWMGTAGLGLGAVIGLGAMAQTAGTQTAGQSSSSSSSSQTVPQRTGTVTPATPSPTLPKPATAEFPVVNPKNFTAQSPSVETVNSFLHAVWGMDPNRTWSVAAIEPTIAPGVVRVQVYIKESTQPGRVGETQIFITPDGKHAIAGDVVNFGAQPFADTRTLLQAQANGPSHGAAGKDLLFVEFVDLQSPTSKTAQGTMDQLAQDFPQARIVVEDLPLTTVHPQAMQAAEVGYCVRQAKGDAAYFKYVQAVYAAQADLTSAKADATLRTAVTTAGAAPAAVMSCASSPAAADAVNATIKLAGQVGVTNTPTLVVNGRTLPLAQVSYEALKKVIVFQGSLDGVTVKEQPSLTTLK